MKVQVNLKVASKSEFTEQVNLIVNGDDTVKNVKERIAASQMVAFPDQDLLLCGKVLDEKKTMTDYGIEDSSSLDFIVRASESSLVSQLSELLQARDLTCDELGLLYCYKHGVSISQALKTVGLAEKLQEFVKRQKEFVVESGRVALVRGDIAPQAFSVVEEVKRILEENSGVMDVTNLCSKFVQKFNVSIASVANMRPAELFEKEKDLFVVIGRGQVGLKSVVEEQRRQRSEVQQPPPRQQVREAKVSEAAPARPQVQPPTVPEVSQIQSEEASDSQQYLDLHNTISGRSFNSKIAQILNDIVEIVTEKSFLNIAEVVKSGSVGKGTAIAGTTDAEVVFCLKGLPAGQQDRWLPALLKAVAGVLEQSLDTTHGVEDICTTTDSVHMTVKGLVEVDLRFSPHFETYADVIQALGAQDDRESRKHFATALVKDKVQFLGKQPGQVKVTMRLLKWWRNQQHWSCDLFRPSDEVLELLAMYSALQTKPRDQRVAIANVMSLMARFDELRIVWSNYYGKEDIWTPLLQQRPLLMDPVNPFVNAADPHAFDPRELMACARTTHFFW